MSQYKLKIDRQLLFRKPRELSKLIVLRLCSFLGYVVFQVVYVGSSYKIKLHSCKQENTLSQLK